MSQSGGYVAGSCKPLASIDIIQCLADRLIQQQPSAQLTVLFPHAAESFQYRLAQPTNSTNSAAQEPVDAESK